MPYTAAIAAIIVGYTWVAAPLVAVRGPWLAVPVVLVVALSIAHDRRTRDWGFNAAAFWPSLAWSALLTVVFAGILWWVGRQVGPLPHREAPLLDFLYVVVWGGAQQFVLHTVILREAQSALGRASAVPAAAAIFAAFHLPNPFLVVVTFIGGLIWCAIYSRHPHIAPLALSHAAATVVILTSFDPAVTNSLRTGWRYFE